MVRIRLRRVGAKKKPAYRVVVADKRTPRDGRFIEIIGQYDPRTDPPTVRIQERRALYWLSVGAQPSEAVAHFFDQLGLPEKLKKVHAGTPIDEVAAAPAAPAPAPAKDEAKPEKAEAKKPAETKTEEKKVEEKKEEAPAEEPEAAAEEAAAEAPAEAVAEEAAEEAPADDSADDASAEDNSNEAEDLAELGLTTRVENILRDAGISFVHELRELLEEGEEKLHELQGIGAKAVEEIREKLGIAD